MRSKTLSPSFEDIAEGPIRGEIYSTERLEEYAIYLAEHLQIEESPRRGRPMLRRMKDSADKLLCAYRSLVEAVQEKETISPAAEWLLDNFHIVEEQLREIRQDLPKSYYEELPKLSQGDLAGYPRIYALSLAILAHTDSHMEIDGIRRFIQAFQTRSYLNIGELWAVAITLRLALVENIRRISLQIVWDRNQRNQANRLADEITETIHDPVKSKTTIAKISNYCGKNIAVESAFISQLAKRLRDQELDIWPAMEYLESLLKSCDCGLDEVVNQEHQRQASNQVTIANIISSMRLLSNINWRNFFESVCLLEQDLAVDPSGDYQKMEFSTRDEYRHTIERIGKRTLAGEREIAQKALELARNENCHVGYFLKGRRLRELEIAFGYCPRLNERVLRWVLDYPTFVYFSSVVLLTMMFLYVPLWYAAQSGTAPWILVGIGLLLLSPTSDLAVNIFNFFLTLFLKPQRLAKMEVSSAVPAEARTLVIIPCLLCDSPTIQNLLEKIEVHYLGNVDPEVYFGLVTDYMDAEAEVVPKDELLVREVEEGLLRLNRIYAPQGPERFFLFHRKRKWNPSEKKWMGWERKRGKIHELNRLLRGDLGTSYERVTAPDSILQTFKYVITLDADTQLGLDTAKKLIGTARHPLNRPVFDERCGRVVAGYGIIQPRISISLESSSRSIFAAVFSGHTGIDPYTTAVSDVYQDLFGEGSFTGKGLYEIDAFEAALKGRVPENRVLSHDLFEGLFARVALATDIELLDDYPSSYTSFIHRQHRWIRGDWQIGRWIFPSVPNAAGQAVANTLPGISRWKIYDNLRRSLVALALSLLFIFGWFILPGSPLFWTGLAVLIIAIPCFLHVANGLFASPRGINWISNLWSEIGKTKISFAQFFLSLAFLAHKAYVETDAIMRALHRISISKEKCLEWVPSAQVDVFCKHSHPPLWQRAWGVQGILLLVLGGLLFKGSLISLSVAIPFILLWASQRQIVDWTRRRVQVRDRELPEDEKLYLQRVARRIWLFFESFVGPEDHWLPPDNVQEDPEKVVAHRTSPTNIGLYSLSIVSAMDLGFLGLRSGCEKLGFLMETVKKLETFQGHLLNWYDTNSLEPLYPKYVSVVDSGNFAGYLLVVKQACLDLKKCALFNRRLVDGMKITLSLSEEEVRRLQHQRQVSNALGATHIHECIFEARNILSAGPPDAPLEWSLTLRALDRSFSDIKDCLMALELEHGVRHYESLRRWVDSLTQVSGDLVQDLKLYVPWSLEPLKSLEALIHSKFPEGLEGWKQTLHLLNQAYVLEDLSNIYLQAARGISELKGRLPNEISLEILEGLEGMEKSLLLGSENIQNLLGTTEMLAFDCNEIFQKMNFSFLLDKDREVFSIGYNVSESRADNAFYDLLASEARLASFVAIIKGDVSQKHWFRLGRQLVPVDGKRALISWSASMFEYLMPQLVMKNYENTLLYETMAAVVGRQISYGKKLNVPWGISEAGFNARDQNFNYQYGPFGIPGLGLKRGLGYDLVVSPYSTFLGALVDPQGAVKNLKRFTEQNLLTCYGFYEAIDFTPSRLAPEQKFSVIRSFMAHHQGMSLIAIDNILNGEIMQERFHAEPRVRAAQLLLQEKIPLKMPLAAPKAVEIEWSGAGEPLLKSFSRVYTDAKHDSPRVQILSNGKYSLMLSTAGSGYSKCEGLAVTRWREDATRDHWGCYLFVRDVNRNEIWSTSSQPDLRTPESYKVVFSEDKVDFRRVDGGVITHVQVIVAPEDNLEMREISLTNDSNEDKVIEVTSYVEPVLAPPADDLAHPAFSNLFLQTEYLAFKHALVARRRPRSAKNSEVWGLHGVVSDGEFVGDLEYETDRARFLGRGKSLLNSQALGENGVLTNTVGSTLDPILSLRVKVHVPAGGTRKVLFTTGLAKSREEILMMVDRYDDLQAFDRERRLAWTKSRIDLRHLGMDSEAAYLFQRLAERILYSDTSLRQPSHFLAEHTQKQANLWPYGISGDLPIVALTVDDKKDLGMIRKLLRGQEFLRMKGLSYDFVILNDSKSIYLQDLHEEILRQIRFCGAQGWLNKPGGVFAVRLDMMPEKDRSLIQAMARVVLSSDWGSLKEQVARKVLPIRYSPPFEPTKVSRDYPTSPLEFPQLEFFNGLGGFTQDGREYVICLKGEQWSPAPWINVIANAHDFGFQVSEGGAGFTWSVNSRENRLTSWSNDPVSDPMSEVIYLRDEETGEYWSPTPLPLRDRSPYIVRHGQGYTKFEHLEKGISTVLTQFVPPEDSVKISRLHLKNESGSKRKLSVWAYVEWVLGNQREKSVPYVFTEADQNKTIYAKNSTNHEFAERISFFKILSTAVSFTCDRKEFLGRNGNLMAPEALRRQGLSGRTGIGHDPCGALQSVFELNPGETIGIVILLGQAENRAQAQDLLRKYPTLEVVDNACELVCQMWDGILGTIQVKTPDVALDFMVNRWLLYQSLVCRLWARSAFYQSGGAFGFRDQLQDCMAFVYAVPSMARAHILKAAARQFPEGDVQHWWHPPTGRGVRTHFSDDLLWLPFVVSHYVRVTGDRGILQEQIPFIEAPLLTAEQEDSYTLPETSSLKTSLLDHCLRTIEHSLKVGEHGLPLIGCGDWNDGMNRVGEHGRGESVWMAWFLYKVIEDFIPYCNNDQKQRYGEHTQLLKKNVELNAWDGQWYRRAFFDDGTPLGTHEGEECKIDSLAQTWSVLSKAGDPQRQLRAMQSVSENLILKDKKIILLLTPPFDKTPLNPGYIKGYVPGVRENGGQYTHAALWVLMAYAELKDTTKVHEIFDMLNPIQHTRTRAGLQKYKIEPYVVAADVYAIEPHVGRGGWSWYTGSASWYYRAGLESLLGFHLEVDHIKLKPCIPEHWRSYEIHYRFKSSLYKIKIENASKGQSHEVLVKEGDNLLSRSGEIALFDDGRSREILVVL